MTIIGHGLTKINVERKGQLGKEDKVENNIKIISIESSKIKIDNKESEGLNVLFEFTVDYGNAGIVELKGFVIYQDSKEKITEILNKWEKEKKFVDEFGTMVYNFIIKRASIKSIQLEDDVNLPLHIVFPRVEIKQKTN